MAPKRIRELKTETDHVKTIKRLRKTIKRLREEQEKTKVTMADRLSNMPESLQLRILSCLDTKHAVQTLMLSKSWGSSWTCIPVLNFNSTSFKRLTAFDKFVFNVLSVREPVKLDKLTFTRHGSCSAKILEKVFEYAFSHGVKELEADIESYRATNSRWPICSDTSSDSLTSLKLHSKWCMDLSLLEPRSGSFKNLTNLNLKKVIISSPETFSGLPALEKLTLDNCHVNTTGNVSSLHALQLEELTISNMMFYNGIKLKTPKLRCFECQGASFPRMATDKYGLPVLDTVVIGTNGHCNQNRDKIMFNNLLKLFNTLCNARSLTVVSSIVHILSMFPKKLANRCSPFRNLKCLKVDLRVFYHQKLFNEPGKGKWLSKLLKVVPRVIAYLLQNSPDAKFTILYPDDPNAKSPAACSWSEGAQTCVCVPNNTVKLA